MKSTVTLVLSFIVFIGHGQTIEELQSSKSDKEKLISELQSQIDNYQSDVNAINKEIDFLTGWRYGLDGILGFDWSQSNDWISSPNPNAKSSGLNINVNAHALRDTEKILWHSKAILNKAWHDVDLSEADAEAEADGLFDNGTVDVLNLSSLAGRKVSEKFAITGLGELNSSIENFLDPGTIDLGVGGTWLPTPNTTVVVNPINYHVAFSGVDGVSNRGALGTKVRVDHIQDFLISSKNVNWTTTLTSFVPYSGKDEAEPTLFEYSWINTLAFEVWRGIGVGFSFGLRNAEFEFEDIQTYQTLGLSYSL